MAKQIPTYIKNRLAMDELASSRGLLQVVDDQQQTTQIQAAKALGLSPGTCNLHFQKLEHMGLICRADTIRKGRGRTTIVWEIEKRKNLCLLFIFDVPFFQATLVDFGGKVLLQNREDLTRVTTKKPLEDRIDKFVKQAKTHASENGATIRQAFFGLPGILDPKTGAVVDAVNFPILNGMDFSVLMNDKYGIPCYTGSLGLTFYYGEIEKLPADTRTTVLYWDLGVGVAAGVGERLISHDHADLKLSEIGHVRIKRNGNKCHCGRNGCLEAYTGGWAILDSLQLDGIQTLEELIEAVQSGNAAAVKAAKAAARLLGENLTWLLQITQSDRLIVSGPLSVIFPVVSDSFIEGLSSMFNADEVEALNPEASEDPQAVMQRGAYRLARRIFLYG